jgi:hypothetical protein
MHSSVISKVPHSAVIPESRSDIRDPFRRRKQVIDPEPVSARRHFGMDPGYRFAIPG